MVSDDQEFEEKAADIIGLYLKPPAHAPIFCVERRRAPSKHWIAWIRFCRFLQVALNGMASSAAIAQERRRQIKSGEVAPLDGGGVPQMGAITATLVSSYNRVRTLNLND